MAWRICFNTFTVSRCRLLYPFHHFPITNVLLHWITCLKLIFCILYQTEPQPTSSMSMSNLFTWLVHKILSLSSPPSHNTHILILTLLFSNWQYYSHFLIHSQLNNIQGIRTNFLSQGKSYKNFDFSELRHMIFFRWKGLIISRVS